MNARTSTIDPTYGIPCSPEALERFERLYPDHEKFPRRESKFGTLGVLIKVI